MREARRERQALTAGVERKVLQAIARRLPAGITSDHLTILGIIGAIGVAAGYGLSLFSPHWLWLASAMLALNWFGDSLDGTVARVRKSERPRYGYYLDHAVDALTTALIGVGIGMSPFVSLEAALVLVVLYLIMSINVYLESAVYGVFRMDYGVVGPTEVRIILIGLNAVLVWITTVGDVRPTAIIGWGTLTIAVLSTGMLALLLWRFGQNLLELGRLEPLHRGEPTTRAKAADRPESAAEIERAPGIEDPDPEPEPTGDQGPGSAADHTAAERS